MSSIHLFIHKARPIIFHLHNPNLPHIIKSFGKYAIKNNYFIVYNLSDKYRYLIPQLEQINKQKNDKKWIIHSFENIITK
jgi:hypothetical protein